MTYSHLKLILIPNVELSQVSTVPGLTPVESGHVLSCESIPIFVLVVWEMAFEHARTIQLMGIQMI